ncbi:carboxylesterase/lipase family protein [Streptomyces candidus]|uniref:Carboxylic ester hydrolase n=1 Tax=Streptomyces candidus TaxID=67283 RepID=A0A7X0LRV2_9ACTN|nr:carboxylesterase/lipase family protein [Streptomyces candidus]MBB6438540.1 para-nitrobenzyl esterase [Streptomyces candidus]GHH45525.1 carboxylic ester hydrolase [Streptomyces candidus]
MSALLLSATGLGATPAVAAPAARAAGDTTVATRYGPVRGTADERAADYLGIPYAAPAVGGLRWKPPAKPARWTGVRDATVPGNPCMQTDSSTPWGDLAGPGTPSEDCLYLNVHTPVERSLRGRPVMVWVHGGGFRIGSGTFYDGGELAARGDVVVVTLNYRLGAFGYLAHPGLAGESADGTSGNYGLLDQQAALRWVRQNIAAFGGDAGNVTVFGESAGGGSVCQHLVSPRAAGLFDRAIAQSGCGFPLPTQESQQRTGATWAGSLGCADVACLRGKPAGELLTASTSPAARWVPNVDGRVLPLQIADALESGKFRRVPVLQGTTADEGRLTVASTYDLAGRRLTPAGYPVAVRAQYGDRADAILARYPLSDHGSPAEALGAILTDSQFACLQSRTARLMARHTRSYQYEFADRQSVDYLGLPVSFPLGAPHGSEIRYVFGGVSGTPAQNALASTMLDYWTHFARTGIPYAADAPRWSQYPKVQVLAPEAITASTTFPEDHKCDLWLPEL